MPIFLPPIIIIIIIPALYYYLLYYNQICGRVAFPIAQICTTYTSYIPLPYIATR